MERVVMEGCCDGALRKDDARKEDTVMRHGRIEDIGC